jgi:3-oxosteroid 1-dehydrogenase
MATAYLRSIRKDQPLDERIEAFLEHGPEMVRYLKEAGMPPSAFAVVPDYYTDAPGAMLGNRGLYYPDMDAALLEEELNKLREPATIWRISDRYAVDMADGQVFAVRAPGWKRRLARIILRYWLDIPWRLKTKRDRRLTLGNALIGTFLLAARRRKIRIERNLPLKELIKDGGAVTGVVCERDGRSHRLTAHRGVILAAGGFEHHQAMRDLYFEVPTSATYSLSPGSNTGDAIRAGQAVGAATNLLGQGWWLPVVRFPVLNTLDRPIAYILYRMPHSMLVNRQTERFTNEAAPYDDIGRDMIDDQLRTGANTPCWMIFDATFRKKYPLGGPVLPSAATPDRAISPSWWDTYLYRAPTLVELATKIELDPAKLEELAERMTRYAASGVDHDFGRGNTEYDRMVCGDPRLKPNAALGAIDKAPFYAVRVDLGDLGTKGGLRVDGKARVLSTDGIPIKGLYAAGNCTGSILGGAYPGPGGTLGPAMTFGYIAATDIALHESGAEVAG